MVLRARIRPFARRAAFPAALGALLVPAVAGTATADAAKRKKKRYPVVTSVTPLSANVGDTITIRGKNFKRGKNKNTVVFKRDGARAIFVKTTLATARQIRVTVPDTLRPFMDENVATRYRLRIFSQRFGKKFTANSKSPMITALPKPVTTAPGGSTGTGSGAGAGGGSTVTPGSPTPPPPPPPPPPAPRVCQGDEDHDLLDAALENNLGLDACNPDSDGDTVPDGYEYKSAIDLNDDEYQDPNTTLPYPGKRPYPNALDKDADVDHDGDSLTLLEEYRLWHRYGNRTTLQNLVYSAGEAYSLSTRDSTGRRRPFEDAATYQKHIDFLEWADDEGYNPVMLADAFPWHDEDNQNLYDIRDMNRVNGVEPWDPANGIDWLNPTADTPPLILGYSRGEQYYYDLDRDGWLSDDERDEDADGLTNYDESHGRLTAAYWNGCYTQETPYKVVYAGTDLTDPDSDDDGVRDGADDQDHDDIPNVMELSRNAASGYADWDVNKGTCHVRAKLLEPPPSDPEATPVVHPGAYGRVNPFNPCLPFEWSRTCDRHPGINGASAPFDGSPVWIALQ
jgi:hypothetical protein